MFSSHFQSAKLIPLRTTLLQQHLHSTALQTTPYRSGAVRQSPFFNSTFDNNISRLQW